MNKKVAVTVGAVVVVLLAGVYWYTNFNTKTAIQASPESLAPEYNQDQDQEPVSKVASSTRIAENNRYSLYRRFEASTGNEQYLLTDRDSKKEVLLQNKSGSPELSYEVIGSITNDEAGKHIAIDEGTSVSRGVSVYSLVTGKEEASFCALSGWFFWKDYFIYRSCHNAEEMVPWEAGVPNIVATNLLTSTTAILVSSLRDGAYYLYRLGEHSENEFSYEETKLFKGGDGVWDIGTTTPTTKIINFSRVNLK